MAWNQTVPGVRCAVQLLADHNPGVLDTHTTPRLIGGSIHVRSGNALWQEGESLEGGSSG
jgi:hypothetical protein